MMGAIRSAKAVRSAFTLIELMVVIAIIALLVALSAGAVMRYLTTQKGNVTETTISTVDSELKKHWIRVIDLARPETSLPVLTGGNTIDMAYGCSGDANLAKVIYIKLKLLQQFPMSFSEVFNTSSNLNILPPDPGYQRYLGQYGIGGSTTLTQPCESSACLLMALERDRSGMKLNTDLLRSSIKTLPSGLPYLADGWDQPLAFYRWPTGNSDVDQLAKATTGAQLTKRDPQDPDGKLMDPNWHYDSMGNLSLGAKNYIASIHDLLTDSGNPIPLPSNPSIKVARPASVYLVPTIVSGGPNKRLGFDVWGSGNPDPMSIISAPGRVSADFLSIFLAPQPPPAPQGNTNDANDNLYNFRLTLGGKGD